MSSQIIEIAWIPLRADAKDSEASASLKTLAPEMRSRPGLESSWQGAPLERPQSLEVVNVWSSHDAYTASRSTPLHEQATKLMTSLIDPDAAAAGAQPYHNLLTLHKPVETVIMAPVAQITNIFLPSDVDKPAFEAAWEELVEHMRANPPEGFIAGAHGWGLEEVNGAKVFTAMSGWESIELNLKGQAAVSDKFEGIQKFSNVFEVHHTSFKNSGEE
ncbi:putative rieske domain-containing protein [Rhypophila decipiens]|uniref:Rieske domain-containing protein n=1 Tax=Rhypophila decipiens TaxID=261697 RepID=A0AAN6XXH1_9PEZI|nr:putative rieske domain-containing protein [Rhypophila decipiens]